LSGIVRKNRLSRFRKKFRFQKDRKQDVARIGEFYEIEQISGRERGFSWLSYWM
jgi:hypothetical protein